MIPECLRTLSTIIIFSNLCCSLLFHQTRNKFSVQYNPSQIMLKLTKVSLQNMETKSLLIAPSRNDDYVDRFCRFMNSCFKNLTLAPIRDYVSIKDRGDLNTSISFFERIITPPQLPGVPRPVSFTILASVPTLLIWYGYYKFSVEEELFYDELYTQGRTTGCGGYGTLLPFVFLFLIGTALSIIPSVNETNLPSLCYEFGSIWILLGQINLYRRVNELYLSEFDDDKEPPLHSWWAVLPPPIDVIVGLRQVHFLAKYWSSIRKEKFEYDVVADYLFPFISSERFTLKEFVLQPKRWFWFTTNMTDFKTEF